MKSFFNSKNQSNPPEIALLTFLELFDFWGIYFASEIFVCSDHKLGKNILKDFDLKLKGVHTIIFGSNIFPNSHLIQKCIQFQQLFWNSCISESNENWEKIFSTKMRRWTPFNSWSNFYFSFECPSSNSHIKRTLP